MKRLGEPLTYRQGWVWQTRFSHDGRWLATASGDDAAQLWDAHCPTNQPVQRFPHGHGVLSVCFSPDDTRVLTASEDGTARVWDRASGVPVTEPLTQSKGHRLLAGSFSPDGREVLTSGVGGTVVWDARVGRALCAPFGHPAGARWASFSPDGSHILTAGTTAKGGGDLPVVRGSKCPGFLAGGPRRSHGRCATQRRWPRRAHKSSRGSA